MRNSFGSVWATQYGAIPNADWIRAMAVLTDEQLVHGLNHMVAEPREFPPNLPLFVSWCQNAQNPRETPHYKLLPLDPPESDEHRAARKARGAERMAEVKAALKGRA